MAGIPERIDRYRILERIGSGGMGTVYRALQDDPQREVALKVLGADRFTPELERRFRVEAAALGRLLHPGIAQVYEAGALFARIRDARRVVPFASAEEALQFDLDYGRFALRRRDDATARTRLQRVAASPAARPEQKMFAVEGLAELARARGEDEAAHSAFEAALDLAKAEVPDQIAFVQFHFALFHLQARRYQEAEALFTAAIAQRRNRQGALHVDTAMSLRELALTYSNLGRLDDAERLTREALGVVEQLTPPDSTERLATAATLARILRSKGDAKAALELLAPLMEHVEAGHVTDSLVQGVNSEYALALTYGGDEAAGLALIEDNVAKLDAMPEPGEALVAELQNLGLAYARAGRTPAAVATFRRAVERARALWPDPHQLKASAIHRLAQIERQLGHLDAAAELHQEALEIRLAVLPPDHQDIASSLNDLGFTQKDRGRNEDALPYFEQARAMDVRLGGERSFNALVSASNLADVHARLGHFDQAAELLGSTVEHTRTLAPLPQRFLGITLLRYGLALRGQRRDADAAPILEEARELLRLEGGPDDKPFQEATRELIETYDALGRQEEAERVRSS